MRARKLAVVGLSALLGAGAAVGVAACGEDRDGELQIEGGATGTAGTSTAPTAPAETGGSETSGS